MLRWWRCLLVGLLPIASVALQASTPEYRAKAGFIYNFISFTQWPAEGGAALPLCIYGTSPFGEELDVLRGKTVAGRSIAVRQASRLEELKGCRVVFVPKPELVNMPRITEALEGEPVLTVSDVRGALDAGIGMNLIVREQKIAFEVNLAATKRAQLNVSAKLLRLASTVRQ